MKEVLDKHPHVVEFAEKAIVEQVYLVQEQNPRRH